MRRNPCPDNASGFLPNLTDRLHIGSGESAQLHSRQFGFNGGQLFRRGCSCLPAFLIFE